MKIPSRNAPLSILGIKAMDVFVDEIERVHMILTDINSIISIAGIIEFGYSVIESVPIVLESMEPTLIYTYNVSEINMETVENWLFSLYSTPSNEDYIGVYIQKWNIFMEDWDYIEDLSKTTFETNGNIYVAESDGAEVGEFKYRFAYYNNSSIIETTEVIIITLE